MILLYKISCALVILVAVGASVSPASDESEETYQPRLQDESGIEEETDESKKDKEFLDVALKTVLDPDSVIIQTHDVDEQIKKEMQKINTMAQNTTIEKFIEEMDHLSEEICKTSQDTLWSYLVHTNDDTKKSNMYRVAIEDDVVKKMYWKILQTHYLNNVNVSNDSKLARKIRMIKERGISVQAPNSQSRVMIGNMQKIWTTAAVCAFNTTDCTSVESLRTLSEIKRIFKSSNDSKELSYYWKAYRDETGKKIRSTFENHIVLMNVVARSENFSDAGEMSRFAFDDADFVKTVDRIWSEVKPLYETIHDYVRIKLKSLYKDELSAKDSLIPAHLLGNIWAQEWQAIYPKVSAYPESPRPKLEDAEMRPKDLFDIVDDFHKSLGFQSANDSYQDVDEIPSATCMPSSHDLCDGVNYRIKWCGQNITDVNSGLTKAARLLGHIQYFKHYKHLELLYRDGPNPAFHDAMADLIAIQVTSPEHLKTLKSFKLDTKSDQVSVNHLLWLGLDKLPLIGYAYVLDKWRWNVFAKQSFDDLNTNWWKLRSQETSISAPVPRDEHDLDPAAKYHVASDIQYISYLISNALEFQILKALCQKTNHTGPLHKCSIYGSKEAGKLLSDGMSLGASQNWRTVLKTMTGETELSTDGLLQYFEPLAEFLKEENKKLNNEDMDSSVPIVIGTIVVILVIVLGALYFIRKKAANVVI